MQISLQKVSKNRLCVGNREKAPIKREERIKKKKKLYVHSRKILLVCSIKMFLLEKTLKNVTNRPPGTKSVRFKASLEK